ncbi:MAG TPA: hypothetical protein VFA07_12085 [Chthonomonadaceae bacterium]|nr:hypothetical protein [Chthonomonadaceae bacterium]
MPTRPTSDSGFLDKMRDTAVNPLIIGIVAVVIVAVLAYVFWIRPEMNYARIAHDWTSPEAVKLRSPEGRPQNPAHEQLVNQLRSQEQHAGNVMAQHRHGAQSAGP